MSTPQERRDQFAMTFNRLLGAAGKTAYNPDESVYTENAPGLETSMGAQYDRKRYKTKATAKKQETKSKKAASQITQEETEAFLRARKDELVADDDPWWKKALKPVVDVGGRGLDIVNRPFAGVVNMGNRAIEAVEQGEPIWSLGDDALYGAWRGLSGKDKSGYGDLIQNAKDVQRGEGVNSGFGNLLARWGLNASFTGGASAVSNKLEDKFGTEAIDVNIPIIDKKFNLNPSLNLDRAVGFAGDVALDPTTYTGIKAVTTLAKGGKEVGEAAVEKMARDAIKETAGQIGRDLNMPAAVKPLTDTATNKTAKELLESTDPQEVAAGKALKDQEDKILNQSQKDAKLIADYESGRITADDFYKEYKKPGSVRSGGIQQIIKDAKKFKSPVDQVVDAIIKVRKLQIDDATVSLRSSIQKTVEDRTHLLINEIQTRSQAGKIAGGVGKDYSNTIANVITEQFRDDSLGIVSRHVETFKSRLSRKALTTAEIDSMKASDKYFKVWHDTFDAINAAKKGSLTPDELTKAYKKADEAVQEAVEAESRTIFATVKGTVDDQLLGVPSLTLMGRSIKEFPRVGKTYKAVKTAANNNPAVENFRKAFSYTANFPGYTSLISQKVKSLGVQAFESFRNDIIKTIKQLDLSTSDRKALTGFLEQGVAPTDPKLAKAYDYIRQKYDEIYDEEVAAGLRVDTRSPRITGYTYTHVKNNAGSDFKRMKTARDKHVKQMGDLDGYKSADLKAMGYKVEDDAFINLLIRQQKSIRKRTNTFFMRDLATHYGIKSAMTDKEAISRGLIKVDPKKVPTWDGIPIKKGENIWIDKEIKDVYDRYLDLARVQAGDDLKQLMRTFDWITRKFKTWNTIYFPAYHMRNMIGDVFMGFMDGVNPNDYHRVFGAMFENKRGMSQSTIRLAGHDVNFDTHIMQAYKNNLTSSSFLNADLGGTLSVKGRTVPQLFRRGSEMREDFGRIAHFYRAMDDELKALKWDGTLGNRTWENALNNASYRVNKFKFDYDALTAVEKKYVRRGIPFYTYMRKAAPTLLESIALQPRYLGTLNKWQTSLEEDWGNMAVPDWLRELSYMRIPGTDTGFTGDILPTGVLRSLDDNPLSRLNPIPQTIIEANTGKDSFSGRTIEGDSAFGRLPEIISGKFRPFTTYSNPFSDRPSMFENENLTGAEKVARFLGLPIRKYDNEEEQAYAEIKYNLKAELEKITKDVEKKGYTVYLSERKDGISLRIKDKVTGDVIFDGQSLKEAKTFIDNL